MFQESTSCFLVYYEEIQWDKDDYNLVVTLLQKPHALCVYGMTPNVIAETSTKVVMASRFLGLAGYLPLEEQNLWLP
jgi:hypothetical protein